MVCVATQPLAKAFNTTTLRKNSRRDLKRGKLRTNLKGSTEIRDHRSMMKPCRLGLSLLVDLLHFVILTLRANSSLAAENLFLRKQLAFTRNAASSLAGPTIKHA